LVAMTKKKTHGLASVGIFAGISAVI